MRAGKGVAGEESGSQDRVHRMQLPQSAQRRITPSVTAIGHVALPRRAPVLSVIERSPDDAHLERRAEVALLVEPSPSEQLGELHARPAIRRPECWERN